MTASRFASTTTQLLILEGEDALAFAHGQFTSDVHALRDGGWQWSGWLDTRGQVIAFFMLIRLDAGRLCLLLRGGDGLALAKRLLMFRLRARVRVHLLDGVIDDAPDTQLYEAAGEVSQMRLGLGDHALRWREGDKVAEGSLWMQRQLRSGLPWLAEHALGNLLPPALSFERLGAISYGKGCYPGQEVAARIHFRGRHKRHMAYVRGTAGQAATLPLQWRVDGREAAVLLGALDTAQGWHALAVWRDESAESAVGGALAVDELGAVEIVERYGD